MASKKRKKKSTEILDTAFLFVKVLAFVLLFGMVVLFAISWYKNKYKPGHQEEMWRKPQRAKNQMLWI